ncbi:unnamed protein product [Protopolystoma xenopodis]|uniref:Uncharacterized protein n=1 Tax=Protopolystoma xenopodis TaxID=117903 RepID=A0A3S5BQM2_9PLAT|nr:unnamed protein product [Protopolystoma xenopodis]
MCALEALQPTPEREALHARISALMQKHLAKSCEGKIRIGVSSTEDEAIMSKSSLFEETFPCSLSLHTLTAALADPDQAEEAKEVLELIER